MPVISHAVLYDDPLKHSAFVEYRSPCVPQTISSSAGTHWTWTVQFIDSNGDGHAEIVMIRAAHRIAPHAGEPAPNSIGPVLHINPCQIGPLTQTMVPDPHGSHVDRMFMAIRRYGFWWFTRRRLYITLTHTSADARIDIPSIPTDGGLLKP